MSDKALSPMSPASWEVSRESQLWPLVLLSVDFCNSPRPGPRQALFIECLIESSLRPRCGAIRVPTVWRRQAWHPWGLHQGHMEGQGGASAPSAEVGPPLLLSPTEDTMQ